MPKALLIVTPHYSFGSMLRTSLEDTGQFRVRLAGNEQSTLASCKADGCDVILMDVDLGVDEIIKIGQAVRAGNSKVDMIFMSDEDPPSELYEIRPWMLLRKPFYIPELMNLLGTLPGDEVPVPGPETPGDVQAQEPEPAWLQDVNKAAQRLTRLTLESSAQAALITRGKSLWAYAGGLSQETANELVQIVTRSSEEPNGGDLLRFARLETTRAEHMLYATSLAREVILALVFDAETPFSTIRSQASLLARSLEAEKAGALGPAPDQPTPAPRPSTDEVEEDSAVVDDSPEIEVPAISRIISDVPAPIPHPVMRAETPEKAEADAAKVSVDPSMLETRASAPLSEAGVIRRAPSMTGSKAGMGQTIRHEMPELDLTVPSGAKRPATPARPPQPGEMDETRPHLDAEVVGIVGLEPASPALYKLNYACLLVPRIRTHYLTGDVAAELGEFLPYICIAFGWRLEFMAVRPEYLQWVVSVPPNTAPGHVMRVIREQTSARLFKEFPRMKKENPSGDFWAPGYLIMGGTQPHPQQLVKEYIKQTRDRQGSSQSR